jgi:predicted amidohydrolase
MTHTRIALANVRIPHGIDDAVAIAEDAVARAARERAAIVCFPECFVPGYRWPGRTIPPPDATRLQDAWDRVAAAAGAARIAVILGTERIIDGRPRLTALVIDEDGRAIGFQDKVQLDPDEAPFYSPGTARQTFLAAGVTFGIAICHEGFRYPETVRWAARRGAQIVFHPHYAEAEPDSYRPSVFGDPANSFHEKSALCRAAENTIYFATVNCASDGSPTTSAVVSPDGRMLAWQPYGVEGLLVVDLDLDLATGLLARRLAVGAEVAP